MAGAGRVVALWDLPVRLCHWGFVALIPALWWTGDTGRIDLHKTIGLVMLGLVAFRLLWGVAGSSNARFASFLKGAGTVAAYLRGIGSKQEPVAGHNPAGGWSVAILLTLLAAQGIVGLFAQDVDGVASGPLNYLVQFDTGDRMRHWHGFLFNLILAFIGVHLAAVAFYAFYKKDDLVRPMVTGSRMLPETVAAPRLASLWRAVPLALFAAGLAWWAGKGAPTSWQQMTAPPAPAVEDYM